MAASIGIWAERPVPGGVLYRWEADHGNGPSGFVTFDPETRRFRPADPSGNVLGDLLIDAVSGATTGSADDVDRRLLAQVAASILRAHARSGEPPKTAHAHFH